MREAPTVISGMLIGENYAIRLAEVVSVGLQSDGAFPTIVIYKNGKIDKWTREVGMKLLAALAGAP